MDCLCNDNEASLDDNVAAFFIEESRMLHTAQGDFHAILGLDKYESVKGTHTYMFPRYVPALPHGPGVVVAAYVLDPLACVSNFSKAAIAFSSAVCAMSQSCLAESATMSISRKSIRCGDLAAISVKRRRAFAK